MTDPLKNSDKGKIKFKKLNDITISPQKKKRRLLGMHTEIKNEDCMFCDDVIHEKKLKEVVKENVPKDYLWKSDTDKEQSQYVALINEDEEYLPNNVFHQEIEVKYSLKGLKNITTPVDMNADHSQLLNNNNKADEMRITTEKKIKNSKHKKKMKQKMCLKHLKRNSYLKFVKKIGRRYGNKEPLRVTNVDENLPYGWKKCAVQRKGGSSIGKWDVFYISPQGRKFRSRNELMSHLKEVDEVLRKKKCEFPLHQRKRAGKPIENYRRAEQTSSQRHMPSVGCSNDEQNPGFGSEPQKRIKTLLPKIRAQEEENETTQICMTKGKCETKDCPLITLGMQPQLEFQKTSSTRNRFFQPCPETSHSTAPFTDLSKTDNDHEENWMKISITAEETLQYDDETKPTRYIKNNVSKEGDISSLSSEYDNMNLEDSHTEEFLGQEAIRCLCGMTEEDGLMIQCDICQCWQHALCNDIMHQDDVPQHFICYFCHHTGSDQQSIKQTDDQDWLYKGQLPRLSFVNEDTENVEMYETTLATSHHLLAELCYVKDYLHCLRAKTAVAQTTNHPKLILWNKNEMSEEQQDTDIVVDVTGTNNSIKDYPQPEAAIDFSICQKKLLEHLHESHHNVEKKLNDIEEKFQDLEKEFTSNGYVSTNETNVQHAIKSMLKDLEKICLMCKYL